MRLQRGRQRSSSATAQTATVVLRSIVTSRPVGEDITGSVFVIVHESSLASLHDVWELIKSVESVVSFHYQGLNMRQLLSQKATRIK